MKNRLLPIFIVSSLIVSTIAIAGIADIKNSYVPEDSISDNFSATSIQPGYQLDSAPATSWKPRVNLDNATGKPTIDLGNSFGNISGTTGINDSIKDHIGNGGGPGGGEWVVAYEGDGTRSIPVGFDFANFKVKVKYLGSGTGTSSRWVTREYTNNALATFSTSNSCRYCSVSGASQCNQWSTDSVTAVASIKIEPAKTVNVPASAYDKSQSAECYHTSAEARISNFVITKLEVFKVQ